VTVNATGTYGSTPDLTALPPSSSSISYTPPSEASSVTGALTCSTTATSSSDVGSYPVSNCSGLSLTGYNVIYNYSGSSYDVTQASTGTVSTPASSGVMLGTGNSDSAVVTGNAGGGAPTGSVTFYECGPTASATPCTSQTNEVGSPVTLTPGSGDVSYASSAALVFNSAGTYCFAAYYSGDPNYSASQDTSTEECFVVGELPTITSFSPASGPPGTTVTIKGTNLSGATEVTIGGVAATIKSNTATKIKVTVPEGAVSGKIKVVTPSGTGKSSTNFKVT
jgi:IPT/TIG domain